MRGKFLTAVVLVALVSCAAGMLASLRWKAALYLSRHTLLLANGCIELVRWPEDWRDRYGGVRVPYGCVVWLRSDDNNEEVQQTMQWLPSKGQYMWYRDYVRLPLWIPMIALAAGGIGLRHLRLRARPGYCRCGYDLRGSSDRCPECGRSIDSSGPRPAQRRLVRD